MTFRILTFAIAVERLDRPDVTIVLRVHTPLIIPWPPPSIPRNVEIDDNPLGSMPTSELIAVIEEIVNGSTKKASPLLAVAKIRLGEIGRLLTADAANIRLNVIISVS